MDLELIETGDGGDIVKTAKDISVIYGLQNMPYLALFGGNIEASTDIRRLPNEQAYDYWANSLLFRDNSSIQYNSLTERTLHQVALTSAGRLQIEQAVLQDLQFMKAFTKVAVSVAIIATDKVRIGVKIQEPDNVEQKVFVFIWDATKRELVDKDTGGGVGSDVDGVFDFTFDYTFN